VTLKVNTISKVSGNNISMQNPLNFKSYTTTARNALTSAAGDMIYNTSTSKVQFYNGSAWNDL
jgi:predicted nucleic acid-binding OB-fold protein